MGSRHVGELLLRPSPLFRNTSIPQPSTHLRPLSPLWSTCRNINTSAPRRSVQPHSQPQNQTQTKDASSEELSRQIDSFFPGYQSNSQRAASRTRQPSSGDEIGAAYNRNDWGAGFSPLPKNRTTPYGSQTLDLDRMNIPTSATPQTPPPVPTLPEEPENYPRLNASTGRSVQLDLSKGRDLVRGLGMLNSLLARNKVKADFMRQRFHERPGLKRKRLKSQRWRARFKVGFQNVVGRVSELTRKGW
ncbi:hypothetical protein K469DRAFT_714590 [Zopfia rhizophila CBS 207.26]|uniref:Ribosomal protein S21 n=1 Tax=Zopfia rhizophila CBS 207.26 TaxID=1314779 RepID=A0A6A6DRK3_9PEZI|nr:hypothetical protein K469DRAFT_714590 [Zopfia rhizophila CBS 207.26]